MSQLYVSEPTSLTLPWVKDVQQPAVERNLSQAPDWRQNVTRYYSTESINNHIHGWLEHSLTWLDAVELNTVCGVRYSSVRAVFDWFGALALLVLLAPLFAAIAVIIKATSKGPVFYIQTRVGRHCEAFRILKFRTMYDGAENSVPFEDNRMSGGMFKVSGDSRVVPVGRVLRRWSLDELPQLVNVLRGEMSLIGPRPLELEHACAVPEAHMVRFALRPGMTGLWQATARDTTDGMLKLALDAEYARTSSWKLDLELSFSTIATVLAGIGAD